jgi:NTP pyrophosphatase (non-canonical NTP hydrolase)
MGAEHEELKRSLREFARDRDWGQFHSPKNLAAALSVEAGELLEHFQWLSEEDSRSLPDVKKLAVSQELADVFIYLLQLSDHLDIDLIDAAQAKIAANAEKYPVALAKGSMRKYTEL